MVVTRQEMKAEALRRMKLLKLSKNVIKDFEKEDTIYYSERCGILYWLSNETEWEEFVKAFEKKHNVVVYHCEFSRLEFGDCLSMLFVDNEDDEWEQQGIDLMDGYCFCYVWNMRYSECSEFGTIGIKPSLGGIKRVS